MAPEAFSLLRAAIECLHCYSLVRDDLPAMDNDALRRGRADGVEGLRRMDGHPGGRWPADDRVRDAGEPWKLMRMPRCVSS